MGLKINSVKIAIPTLESDFEISLKPTSQQNFLMRDFHLATLKKIQMGLQLSETKLNSGRSVNSTASALFWVLEQVEKQIEKQVKDKTAKKNSVE
jgi:hypothetical protein